MSSNVDEYLWNNFDFLAGGGDPDERYEYEYQVQHLCILEFSKYKRNIIPNNCLVNKQTFFREGVAYASTSTST